MIVAENFQLTFEEIMYHYISATLHEPKQKVSGVFPIIFEHQKGMCQTRKSMRKKGIKYCIYSTRIQYKEKQLSQLKILLILLLEDV